MVPKALMQTTEVVAYVVGVGLDWGVGVAAAVLVLVGTGLGVRVAVAVAPNVGVLLAVGDRVGLACQRQRWRRCSQ